MIFYKARPIFSEPALPLVVVHLNPGGLRGHKADVLPKVEDRLAELPAMCEALLSTYGMETLLSSEWGWMGVMYLDLADGRFRAAQ